MAHFDWWMLSVLGLVMLAAVTGWAVLGGREEQRSYDEAERSTPGRTE